MRKYKKNQQQGKPCGVCLCLAELSLVWKGKERKSKEMREKKKKIISFFPMISVCLVEFSLA